MSGFVATPGSNFSPGDEPDIARRLDALAKKLGVTIFGISGYRTPSHSVAVGGFANDPHTRGQAADIGVNGQLRASAAQITDAQLASVGLYRPFPGAAEINHVQIKPGSSIFGKIGGAIGDAAGFIGRNALPQGKDPKQPDLPGLQVPDTSPANAAGDAAKATAGALVGLVVDSIDRDGARVLLSIALVLAALALIAFGVSRALGLRTPPISPAAIAAAVV